MQGILEFKDHLRDLFKLFLFGCNLRRLMDKMSSVQSIQQLNNDWYHAFLLLNTSFYNISVHISVNQRWKKSSDILLE